MNLMRMFRPTPPLAILGIAIAVTGCSGGEHTTRSAPEGSSAPAVADQPERPQPVVRFDDFRELPGPSMCGPETKVAVTSYDDEGRQQVDVASLATWLGQSPSPVSPPLVDAARWTHQDDEWMVVACRIDGDELAIADEPGAWTAVAYGEPHFARIVLAEVLRRSGEGAPWRLERTWRERATTYENMSEITPMSATIAEITRDETGRAEFVVELVSECGDAAPPCKPPRVIRGAGDSFTEE